MYVCMGVYVCMYGCVCMTYLARGRAVACGSNNSCRRPTHRRMIPFLQTLYMKISRVSSTFTRSHQRVLCSVVCLIAHVTDEFLPVGDALFVVSHTVRLVTRVAMTAEPFLSTLGLFLYFLLFDFVSCQSSQFVPLSR